jgi:hypothetical protein
MIPAVCQTWISKPASPHGCPHHPIFYLLGTITTQDTMKETLDFPSFSHPLFVAGVASRGFLEPNQQLLT